MKKYLLILFFLVGCFPCNIFATKSTTDDDIDEKPNKVLIFEKKLLLDPSVNYESNYVITHARSEIFQTNIQSNFSIFSLERESKKNYHCSLFYNNKENIFFIVLLKYMKNEEVEEIETRFHKISGNYGIFGNKKLSETGINQQPYQIILSDLSNKYVDVMLHSSMNLYCRGLISCYDNVYKNIKNIGLEKAINRILIKIDKNFNCSVYSVSNTDNFLSELDFNNLLIKNVKKTKENCCLIF